MNLKPQTVYIPVDRHEIKEVPLFYVSEFRNKDWNYLSHTEKKENQICLSKEELVGILNTFFYSGQEYERNISLARDADKRGGFVLVKSKHASDLINNLFNQ